MNLPDVLKEYRKKSGFSQKELAKKTGLSIGTIQGYEQGKYLPKIENLKKIADALSIALSVFLDKEYADAIESGKSDTEKVIRKNFYEATEFNDEERAAKFKDLLYNQELAYEIFKDGERETKLITSFRSLNNLGQNKAIEQVDLLTKIPEYRKDKE